MSLGGTVVVDLTSAVLSNRAGSLTIIEFNSYCGSDASKKRDAPQITFANIEPVQSAVSVPSCGNFTAYLQNNPKSIGVLYSLSEPKSCAPSVPPGSVDVPAIAASVVGSLVAVAVTAALIFFLWKREERARRREEDKEMDLEIQDAAEASNPLPMTARSESDLNSHYTALPTEDGAIKNLFASLNMIDSSSVKILQEIGSGSYGKVYLGVYKGALVAVKQTISNSSRHLESFLSEAAIHQRLPSHPNICKMYGLCIDKSTQTYSIVIEFCPHGSILDFTECTSQMSDLLSEGNYETFKVVYGIALGMAKVSCVDVVHRDLSARNVLLDERFFPKVSDFGISRAVSDAREGSTTSSNLGPVRWLAPEALQGHYSEKSDVWSFGCCLIELITLEDPYCMFEGDILELAVAIRDEGLNPLGDLVEWIEEYNVRLPRWVRDVLEPCFEASAADRPTFAAIVEKLRTSKPDYQLQYETEADLFVETPISAAPSALVAMAAAVGGRATAGPALNLEDSVGFGDDSSSSSSSTEDSKKPPAEDSSKMALVRALSKELPFTPRFPDVSKARILTELGSGSFGTVYLGKFQGRYVAIKQLSDSGGRAAALIKEAGMMLSLTPHRNVVSLVGVRTGKSMTGQGQAVELIMEYATRGSLLDYVKRESNPKRGRPLPDHLVFRFALGIARGMASLAGDKLVHRDLAARNILLNSTLEPLVSDFGFARQLADGKSVGMTFTKLGPIRWMPPESLAAQPEYSEASDVWSYGVLLLEIVTRETPFASLELLDVATMVKSRQLTPFSYYKHGLSHFTPAQFVVDLVEKIFQFEPAQRPSFADVVSWLETNAPATVRKAEERRVRRQEKRDKILEAMKQILV